MQATRKITYGSVANTLGAQTIFSAATTWGELKNENADVGALGMNMKPWIKGDAQNTQGYGLTSDSSPLPAGDFTLYFLVNKNDSGK